MQTAHRRGEPNSCVIPRSVRTSASDAEILSTNNPNRLARMPFRARLRARLDQADRPQRQKIGTEDVAAVCGEVRSPRLFAISKARRAGSSARPDILVQGTPYRKVQ